MPSFTTSDGVRLHYETEGAGPPLVFQTGGAGDGSMWRDAGYVDAMSATHRCILLDHRGHGRSDRPRAVEAHSVQRYARDVVELLDHLELERALYWGYSQGAEIGLVVAAWHPSRLRGLVASGLVSNPDRDAEAKDVQDSLQAMRSLGWEAIVPGFEAAGIPEWFKHHIRTTDPEMVCLWFEGLGGWNPWEEAPSLSVPVLVVVGDQEDPYDWNGRLVRLMPDGRHVRLAGEDHLSAYVRVDMVVPAVREFLATH